MSHLDTWEPKPGRPTQGDFEPIKTSADGIQISEIFPQVAQEMKHAALIRSVTSPIAAHGLAPVDATSTASARATGATTAKGDEEG